ncbi:MAG: DNA sulfur modification protein DndD [Hydrogenophaga sp.]|nr:DNA sulfur modification protein DndD [Hydrogenophaga sp.]
MILRSLKLENFGLYQGVTVFDLVPRKNVGGETPIILIGGRNGAGKTTFLEALRLALYGKRSLGTRVGQSEYEQHLRSRLHRGSRISTAAVSLEFDYAESGVVHRYVVRREWSVRGETVVEAIELEKDGKTITSVPREEWHQFLQELIPPGLSQLFFFDGEKIQEIADGSGEEEYLADAVRGLLGIELVNRLRTDLALYLARHRTADQAADSLANRLEANIRDIVVAQRRADEVFEETAELASRRDSLARTAEQARRRFVAEGGDIALGRARLEADIEDNKRLLYKAEADFRDLSNKLLPFIYAPKLLAKFSAALNTSTANDIDPAALAQMLTGLEKWQGASANWTHNHRADLIAFIEAKRSGGKSFFAELPDRRAALATLEFATDETVSHAAALHKDLTRLVARADDLARSLARADSAASGVMLDDLREADKKVGSLEASLLVKQEELRAARYQIAMLEREQGRLLEEQSIERNTAHQQDLGARTAKVLLEYEYKLLTLKLKQLQAEFLRCFAHLARKAELVGDVKIDPSTFAVTLFDSRGDVLPKSRLSAGEKQIYATAMLWALARTSGRHLPMIIDTPLARLDTEHRARLVERYFPAASHQVILLSTDTEIDVDTRELLEPYVSHSFHLEFDPVERRSIVSPGYFTNGDEEVSDALQQA